MKAVVFPSAPLSANKLIKGPERDPKNPDKELPDSDVRRRTWIAEGDVRLRLVSQQLALDADEVTIIWKSGKGTGVGTKSKSVVDPLKKEKEPPFERLIARGRVRVMFVDNFGRVQVGRAGYMVYEAKSGEFLLKDWPEVQMEDKLVRGTSKTSVARMSRLKDADFDSWEVLTLEDSLKAEDLPADRATPVPAAPPVKGDSSTKVR